MHNSAYQTALDWLFQQFPSYQLIGDRAYKPTLDNIRKLADAFGNPEEQLRFIHVAGTNGKGSSSSMMASILQESGETVGLFTSPHLLDFRERIRVNGAVISEQDVIEFVAKIQHLKLDFEPSFFEITFIMALHYFLSQNCTICVIETGMGGRLDATNIVKPLISVITNISKDHEKHLGSHLYQIAREKAGIMKDGVPTVFGEQKFKEATTAIISSAKEKEIDLFFAEKMVKDDELYEYELPMIGNYQFNNLRTILAALQLIEKEFPAYKDFIQIGLKNIQQNTGLIGRMQVMDRKPLLVYDVSHNEDGVRETINSILPYSKNSILHILFGASADKDVKSVIKALPLSAKLHFTSFHHDRSMEIEQLKAVGKEMGRNAISHNNPKEALSAIRLAAKEDDVILVMGSFFLIAELLK
ncbi:MAG: folylpolyglutamate synthase/dihydrofolate synthase family protein [Bacteroidota bacterium]